MTTAMNTAEEAIYHKELVRWLYPFLWRKTFCDIGCAEGGLVAEAGKFAARAYGLERRPEAYQVGKDAGLELYLGDSLVAIPADVPQADVYYIWIAPLEVAVEYMQQIKNALVVIGDFRHRTEDIKALKGEINRISLSVYDDGYFELYDWRR